MMLGVKPMSETEILRSKIRLKKQAIPLIRQEIIDDQLQLALLIMKGRLEDQIENNFDLQLSRKLDAITVLLEN